MLLFRVRTMNYESESWPKLKQGLKFSRFAEQCRTVQGMLNGINGLLVRFGHLIWNISQNGMRKKGGKEERDIGRKGEGKAGGGRQRAAKAFRASPSSRKEIKREGGKEEKWREGKVLGRPQEGHKIAKIDPMDRHHGVNFSYPATLTASLPPSPPSISLHPPLSLTL